MKKKLTLGLFGFGCVGQGLYRVLSETHGLQTQIRKICIKHPEKSRSLPADFFTTDAQEVLNDPSIDVIVELIDNADQAWEIVQRALKSGKAVVTANKKMVATRLDELKALERECGRPVLYEGAVCGSIPIIRNLEEYYDNDSISRIEGIVNGSTNYILTKVVEEGISYIEALNAAQRNGFAESDPTLDVKAFDPAYKLSILIAHTFGIRVSPEEITRVGIDRISHQDLAYAKTNQLRIKLVAGAYRQGNKVVALVAPKFVDQTHPLFAVRNEFNAVSVEGLFAEEQLFVGKGAGGNATGSAVLSDISALRYDYQYEYRKASQERNLVFETQATVNVVVSCDPSFRISPADFVKFRGGEKSRSVNRLEGEVTLATLAHWSGQEDISVILAPGSLPRVAVGSKQEELEAA